MIEDVDPRPLNARNPRPLLASSDLITLLSQKVVGQSAATKAIVPYVYMYQSGLAPEGRPAGVFLLLGPTGTGKTKTVEAIAELLHGSEKKIVKIDCGEFQLEHEMAKLIGAPPGYLGHRETVPMLTQERLAEATSPESDLALVLFDEIEKAAHSMTKLLLGILDKGILRLGDNSVVNFEKSLIFFTSNLGAREMLKVIGPDIGFQSSAPRPRTNLSTKLETIALGAVRKRFSPEFVNRIDAVVTYQPLDLESMETILDHDIKGLQRHVNSRLGKSCFMIEVLPEARNFLLKHGVSEEYGARELKRTIHRQLTQPLATMVTRGEVNPSAIMQVSIGDDGERLAIREVGTTVPAPPRPSILIVDDNHDLLLFLATELKEAGWEMLIAESASTARRLFHTLRPGAVLLDYLLGDDDGLKLGLEFQAHAPATKIVIMTGAGLSDDELTICAERNFPILFKPFLAHDVLNLIRESYRQAFAARAGSINSAERGI
jgi:ActR/RegA family two-component response regulator/energy-coupling factor transporter ATP-binding protein EcfA2